MTDYIALASQYYEKLKTGECDPVDAVIKIRYLIGEARCSLAVLEPQTPKDKTEEVENEIRAFLEEKIGGISADHKNAGIREAIDAYGTLTSGHPCDISNMIRSIRININNAGTTLAALEPEIPEDRKLEVEARIASYLERIEETGNNHLDENPPPSFTWREKSGRAKAKSSPPGRDGH